MKHLKHYNRFSDLSHMDEAISWSDVKIAYKKAKSVAINVIKAFKQEGKETSNMLKTFNYQLRKKLNLETRRDAPTPDEITSALEQLKEIPKLAPYAIILLASPIPFSSTMYTGAAIYLKKITNGYLNLLPDSFKDVFKGIEDSDIEIEKDRKEIEFKDDIQNPSKWIEVK
jgi:hypothetical protein